MAKLTREDILTCAGKTLAIDTETTGLHWYSDGLIGIGIHCPQANVSGYAHTCIYREGDYGKPKKRETWEGDMDFSKSKRGRKIKNITWSPDRAMYAHSDRVRVDHFLPAVWEICHDPKTTIIGHNLKFDAHFLQLRLWELPCRIIDTAVLVHLIDSNLQKSLAAAEAEFLGTSSKRKHVSEADKRFGKSPWMWGEKVLEDYCTNDCAVTYQLAETLMPVIREMDLKGMLSIQMKYLRLLQKVEWRGIKLEQKFCYKAIQEFEKNILDLEQELFDVVGKEFNWRSSVQLSQAIYDDLGIPKPKSPFPEGSRNAAAKMYTKTATGTPLLLKTRHPARKEVIVLRETVKLKEYAEKYLKLADDQGALHSSFNITGAVTGRLSSSDPNLQQLAAKYRKYDLDSEYTGGAERVGSYNLRQSLVARPGYKIISIDHKQQEARLLAILSQEPTLLQYMAERKDIHLAIAIRVWGDCGPEQNKKHRDWSKATVFGLTYGMSSESLQEYYEKLEIEADAEEVRRQFFATFPHLLIWFEEIRQKIVNEGGIRYWSGRYWFPEYPGEEYKGINAIIQGGAGDFLSVVLVRANRVLEAQGWGYLISIIHDEALFEIEEKFISIAAPVLSRVMEGEDIFSVPFLTDIEVGDSYGSLNEYRTDVDLTKIDWKEYLKEKVEA